MEDALARGITRSELRTGVRNRRWHYVARGVLVEGPARPDRFERAIGTVISTGGVACGSLAGVLHELDNVPLLGPPHVTLPRSRQTRRAEARHRDLAPERITTVCGIRCTDGLQTLVDLAVPLDDLRWEQAAESAFFKKLTSPGALEAVLPDLGRARTPGARRIRRVLTLRPPGAPPTESLLETLMVQLVRTVPGLPEPVRQLKIYDEFGEVIARLDLAWPELGLFAELDGEHHNGQPLYDASRETAVVARTGWMPARFTWTEVTRVPAATARRLAGIAEQCRLRPVAAS